jgi:uncharacterized phage protein (TIGR02220 family)
MRYGTINCEFWVEEAIDINELCGNGVGNAIMHYLKSSEFSNMLGVYPLSLDTLVRRVNLGKENVLAAFSVLCSNGYVMYDYKYEYVWVVNMAFEQTFPGVSNKFYSKQRLAGKDTRISTFNKILSSIPSLCFLDKLFEKYSDVLCLKKELVDLMIKPIKRPTPTPSDGVKPPHRMGSSHPIEWGQATPSDANKQETRNSNQETVISNIEISNDISCAASSTKNKDLKKQAEALRTEQAKKVIDFLNKKAGTNFEHVDVNLNFIKARMKDGATFEQLIAVTANKCLEWENDPVYKKFRRPKTLYNATNFASYVGALPRHAKDDDFKKGDEE